MEPWRRSARRAGPPQELRGGCRVLPAAGGCSRQGERGVPGGGAKGGPGAGKGRFSGRERGQGSPRVSREAGRVMLRQSWKPARKGKAVPQEAARHQGDVAGGVGALKASADKKAVKGKAGARQTRAAESKYLSKAGGAAGAPGASSTSLGLSVVDKGRRGKGGAPSVEGARGLDLGFARGEGPLDYEEDDPGEQDAARVHWKEGKADPGSASRMASAGWSRRCIGAADASSGRCGGEGIAPPVAAAQEEQRPGPSRRRSEDRGEYSGCVRCGGSGVSAGEREERSEESLEEGELRNSGSEYDWWERGGRGTSNPVRQSFQVQRSGTRRGERRGERRGGEERTVQEQPPLLSPESPGEPVSAAHKNFRSPSRLREFR
ncbi:hypothetical protein NDU88_003381 [Pleurodeles waltl]|uniref:Uncharacterized protein n=1 Tax=Pleurodeles waltl TaxID=8319 RepID=A0AAV7MVF4_PLEWA|nr:hypothetical protein NDU88_003381 [Pleurodeles waltl]